MSEERSRGELVRSGEPAEWPESARAILERTPARILVRRVGGGYATTTQLKLREDHAAARDAVKAEFELRAAFGAQFVESSGIFEIQTRAKDKREYLLRPDLGRKFSEEAKAAVSTRCAAGCDLQILVGDGLSVAAVAAQGETVVNLLMDLYAQRGWRVGQLFAVRYCRVGLLNEVGELLRPRVAVLLIGERPGLATAESLSAYMAYEPKSGDSDAQRNLISNIHARGVSCEDAAQRIVELAEAMMGQETSGVGLAIAGMAASGERNRKLAELP